MGKDLLMKSFAVLKYLGLFSVNLIIIASVIACVSSAPYVSNKNTNRPVSEKKKYDDQYYEKKVSFYKDRYKQRYGSVVNSESKDKDITSDNENISPGIISSPNKPHPNTFASESNDSIIELTPPITPKLISTIDMVSYGNYHALIIGNNSYHHLPLLKTAINDAQVVAQILQQDYNYHVEVLLDASRANILLALEKYRSLLTKDDNLLIYYAGHGWLDQKGDEGYWLPVDASENNPINWISTSSITTYLKAIEAKHIMIVADSCYSGKLSRGLHINRKTPSYLSRISQKKARVVLTSGGLEPVADSGGKNNHSVFASAFIDVLNENQDIIDGTELFTKIRRPVILNSEQTPEYSDIYKAGHDGGDFIFLRINISQSSD
jgi:hypothetical protein